MGLAEYKRKRDFRRTPEPTANGKQTRGNAFVVQKHAASHLHYDFRLELDGTLKSWAVPKGPSLNPSVKSLAVHVEDHPLSYADFEGVIPEGEYGAGTVMVWDQGRWEPEGDPSKAYKSGKLSFVLQGKKLKGRWSLVRMGGRAGSDGKNWLLIKSDDRSANKSKNITTAQPKSVLSGRDMKEIAAARDKVWQSNGKAHKPKAALAPRAKSQPKKSTRRKVVSSSATLVKQVAKLTKAKKKRQPTVFKPQLATLSSEVPKGDSWLHEMKLDGYRILVFFKKGEVRLITRNGNDWAKKFPSLVKQLNEFPFASAILDGEVVSLTDDGQPNFQRLQNLLTRGDDKDIVYYVFDVPYFAGYSLTETPLSERKQFLRELLESQDLSADSIVRYSDHIEGHGEEVLSKACQLKMEGVVSKRSDCSYTQTRSLTWIKTKCLQRQEFVIGGYTKPTGSRIGFGALLVGYYEKGKLKYAGRVGTGFNRASLRQIFAELKKRKIKESPFDDSPRGAAVRDVTWVKPQLVGEIEFTEWTNRGSLRHPSFQGLREDKPAKEIVREKARPVKKPGHKGGSRSKKTSRRRATGRN